MKKVKIEWPAVPWQEFLPAPVIGVDEVGRGCLAGPVYAAAVILDPKIKISDYTDSKLVSVRRREELAEHIQEHHHTALGFASVDEIDELNILQASLLAMKRAVENLGIKSGHILVDGKFRIPDLKGFQQTPIIKGDLRCKPISAASILAKVIRDRLMEELHKEFPVYEFKKHKGYSTPQHKNLIKIHRPCCWHRKSFAGVKEYY